MNNFKMIVSYDGTRYYGWEHQPNTDMTIQGKLETVLTQMLETTSGKTPDRPVTVIGAGRTDAGVHARAMTANVLLDTDLSAEEIQKYMNRYLPDDISVIGFDDLPISSFLEPPLTTVRQERTELGKCGYAALSNLINHVSVSMTLLRPQLITRASTAPCAEREEEAEEE